MSSFGGFLEEKMYVNKFPTLQQIEDNVQRELQALDPEKLTAVMEKVLNSARLYEAENGRYLTEVIVRN